MWRSHGQYGNGLCFVFALSRSPRVPVAVFRASFAASYLRDSARTQITLTALEFEAMFSVEWVT